MNLVCRSALYMPASNARALEKARSLSSDAVIVDLEDSVNATEKTQARTAAQQAIQQRTLGDKIIVLRLNGSDTPWFEDDISAAIIARPDAVLLPKVESADTIKQLASRLAQHKLTEIAVWAMIETPMGISEAHNIAAACAQGSSRAACCLGNNDLTIAANMQAGDDRQWLIPWMMQLLLACKTYGVACLDGVFNQFSDLDGFTAECKQGAAMGFDGKTLIHPTQISIANRSFSPSEETLDHARKIVAAFQLPDNESKSAIQIEGEMVERLHLEWAERVLLTVKGAH